MILTTSRCSRNGHFEIRFEVDGSIAPRATWLVEYFEKTVETGITFQPDQTVQLGWMVVRLCKGGAYLEIWEPDFDAFPIRWRRGANSTLRHLSLQRSVCDALRCEPIFPSILQAGIVSPHFEVREDFVMSRDHFSSSDSGWVFTEAGYGESGGRFVSLYQIALFKPSIIPFLALPESALVRVKPGAIEANLGSHFVSSRDNDVFRCLAQEIAII